MARHSELRGRRSDDPLGARADVGCRSPGEPRAGTCGSLGEVVVPLANLVITSGDLQGQTGATPVEQSGTVVQFAIADFLASDHVVVVRESPAVNTVVACGDVGGALNPDGTLAVGMLGMNGSGLSGSRISRRSIRSRIPW